jgi:hypothetical protein
MSRTTRIAALLLLVACTGLWGCATAKFASAYDKSVDFSKYHSYAFRADRTTDDPDRQRLAENIINQELGAKGFRLDAAAPDLLIGLAPFSAQDTEGGMLAAGTVTWSYQGPYDGIAISSGGLGYKEVELSVGFTDSRTGKLVWHGVIKGKLSYDDREGSYQKAVDTLRRLLKGFPPKSK